jgi:hypothetical protein
VIRVWIKYKSLPDLIASLPQLLVELRSPEDFRPGGGGERDSLWTRDSLLQRYGDRLDAYFAKRGCSQQESLCLTIEVLRRLYQGGPQPDWELDTRVRELAWVAYRDRYGEPPGAGQRPARPRQRTRLDWGLPLEEARAFEARRLRSALSRLDRPVVRTLDLWLDSQYDEVQLSVLLQISPDRVFLWLDLVASRLRLSRDQLADPRLRQAVRERLELPMTQQSDC